MLKHRTIHKFELSGFETIKRLPLTARVVSVHAQRGKVYIYADVPVGEKEDEPRTFLRLDTGVYFPKDNGCDSKFRVEYIGTVHYAAAYTGDEIVEHVFEIRGSTDAYHEAEKLLKASRTPSL